VCDRVVNILGARVLDSFHNHYNFACRETHNGRDLWVVRKGATPAFPGQRGFVGGTMGETSVILEGIETEHASLSLYSTIHGAGRVMGRMEAKGKRNKAGEQTREPKVTQEMMDAWVNEAHVELRGGGIDESPHCYKRLEKLSSMF
jgi:tRNA-splicing ligase RtcB